MSTTDVDGYLGALAEPSRGTLEEMRARILGFEPGAEQLISYGFPAFRLAGHTVAGFAAFKAHLSYLPFSGSVLPAMEDQLNGYTRTKSALHFAVDEPLPLELIRELLTVRMREAGLV